MESENENVNTYLYSLECGIRVEFEAYSKDMLRRAQKADIV